MSALTRHLTHDERTYSGPLGSDAGTTILTCVAEVLWQWSERAKQRRQLSGLTPRELKDVGISVEAAAAEAAKPFWRP